MDKGFKLYIVATSNLNEEAKPEETESCTCGPYLDSASWVEQKSYEAHPQEMMPLRSISIKKNRSSIGALVHAVPS
ncbi:hypothetical protein LENED_005203 [Lentinula edodes]|uniref:Uncharacterized protein n=1 Tax=Lentinula edodes TaxID=5353 RepID=A0A1Q3E8A1_LENED|nr:hypothetical protein LENED_005203 [Lentinula edodes]